MPQARVYPIPSCTECGIESAARCPTCRRSLCMDHFGCRDHEPCATSLVTRVQERACYVCGVPVTPEQWSAARFLHYVDTGTCRGCGRYICDALHTRFRDERVELVNESLRSQRYHRVDRYCDACAPVRRVGGLVGVGRVVAAITAAAALALFIVQRGI
jgi:hypothetical protein